MPKTLEVVDLQKQPEFTPSEGRCLEFWECVFSQSSKEIEALLRIWLCEEPPIEVKVEHDLLNASLFQCIFGPKSE